MGYGTIPHKYFSLHSLGSVVSNVISNFKRLPQVEMSMVAATGKNGAVEPEALVCVCVCVCVCASVCATLGMRFRRLRARVLKQFFSSTLAKHVRDGQAFGVE